MKKYLKIYFRFPSNGMFPYWNNGHKQHRNYKIKRQSACFVPRIFPRLNSQKAAAVAQGLIYFLLFHFLQDCLLWYELLSNDLFFGDCKN